MVIQSVGICNKNGKLLLSRQFEQMSRTAVEDIYFSFPKLIQPNQQHTYVESEKHLFIYIPFESLYLVLISTKNSNIIEDQQTIKTLYKILIAICSEGISQETIEQNSVDIILAMDDIISMGYRESITLQEVMNQLKMDSAEEKAHLALMKQREEEAKQNNEKRNQSISN